MFNGVHNFFTYFTKPFDIVIITTLCNFDNHLF